MNYDVENFWIYTDRKKTCTTLMYCYCNKVKSQNNIFTVSDLILAIAESNRSKCW